MREYLGGGAETQRSKAAVGHIYRSGRALTLVRGGTAKMCEMAQTVLAVYAR
jgi:hypothetical protein